MNESVEIKNGQDMRALMRRIDKGNPKPEDLIALSTELDKYPAIYRSTGNLQSHVFSEILGEFVSSAVVRECAQRYVEEMKTELGYKDSTFVEKMLIDEIIMRWLRLQNMEMYHKNGTSQSHTPQQGMYVDKRLHLTQKRFLRAIETLAKVRKMIGQTQAAGAEMFKKLMVKDG